LAVVAECGYQFKPARKIDKTGLLIPGNYLVAPGSHAPAWEFIRQRSSVA